MRPYITCFMMMSLDGRIDCAMTEKIEGSKEYYQILNEHNFDSCLSGKVTAKMHYALNEEFKPTVTNTIGTDTYFKAIDSNHYQIIVDTNGTLMYENNKIGDDPMIIIVSENATVDYISYLKKMNISYIVSGKNKIDFSQALEVLNDAFDVKTLGLVGGGLINGGFLDLGLIDEISMLIGPGIDGRKDMNSVFDGLSSEKEPTKLTLKNVVAYDDGAIWIKYSVNK